MIQSLELVDEFRSIGCPRFRFSIAVGLALRDDAVPNECDAYIDGRAGEEACMMLVRASQIRAQLHGIIDGKRGPSQTSLLDQENWMSSFEWSSAAVCELINRADLGETRDLVQVASCRVSRVPNREKASAFKTQIHATVC